MNENWRHFSLSTVVGGMVVAALWSAAYTSSLKRLEMERTINQGARWLGIVRPQDRDKINVLRIPAEYRSSHWKIHVPEGRSVKLYTAAIPGTQSALPLTTSESIRKLAEIETMQSREFGPGTHDLVVSESEEVSNKNRKRVDVSINDDLLWRTQIVNYLSFGYFDCDTKALPDKQHDPEVILQTRYQIDPTVEKLIGLGVSKEIDGFIIWLEW